MFDNLKVLIGKRRIMKYSFASGLACALFLMACQPDEEPTPPDFEPYVWTDTTYQDPEFLSYWLFKEGSQWIYKRTDTTAEMYDTATVVNYLRKIQCKPGNSSCEEYYMIHITHTHHDIINEDFHSGNKQIINTSGFQNIYVQGPDKSFLYFDNVLRWPIKIGKIHPDINIRFVDTLKQFLPSIQDSVPSIHTVLFENNLDAERHIYTTPEYGFIKFKFPDGSTWELIEHDLRQ